jgi:sugar phosphate isomerase/epimerase
MLFGAMNSPLRLLLKEVEDIGSLGFDYLELTMDSPHAHYGVIKEQKRALLKVLDRFGMALVCHLPTFVSTADLTEGLREASIQETLLSLREASGLKPLKVVLHPSFIQGLGTMMMDQARRYATEALDRILKEADRLAVSVCVENLFPRSRSLVNPEDFDDLFGKFPGARLTLDTGHANIGRGGDERIVAFIQRFAGRIGHVHASDNSGRDDDHLPIGVGSIDFTKVVKALKGIGYDDTITLEVFARDRDYLRISREKLSGLFASIR